MGGLLEAANVDESIMQPMDTKLTNARNKGASRHSGIRILLARRLIRPLGHPGICIEVTNDKPPPAELRIPPGGSARGETGRTDPGNILRIQPTTQLEHEMSQRRVDLRDRKLCQIIPKLMDLLAFALRHCGTIITRCTEVQGTTQRTLWIEKCPVRDLNPHGLLHQILSLACLPISPTGHG